KNIKIINEVKEAIINVKAIYENISSSSEETNITIINNDTTDIFNLIPTGINEHLDLLLNIREENIEDIKDIINELEILKEIKIEIIYDSKKLQYILKIKEKDFFNNFINKNINNGNNDTYENMINTNSTYTNAISISPFIPEIVFYSNKRKYVYFSTIDINKINHRITEAEEKIVILIYEHLKDYFSNIDYSVFYILADKIALVDIIISFLAFGKKYDCCLPKILDNKKTFLNDENNKRVNVNDLIFVENTYNLLLEDNYVKNCIYSSSLLNFTLITGNNMSGKTTYMKNIANIIILSQIGSPINAKSATLRLFDSILTRISHNNHISCSTFKKELIDIKFMLEFDNSLLLIDEFGRSSGFTESIDLCYKICKRLIRGRTDNNKYFIENEIDDKTTIESSDIQDQNMITKEEVIKCNQTVDMNIRTIIDQKNNHVFFVTHFRELLSLLSKYKNVNVINSNNFKVTSGISKDIDGIKLIENILNYNVIEESRRIRKILFKEEDIKYYDRTIIQYGMELEKDKNFNIKKHLNRE
ncbi:MUTS DNA mismatch repair protein-like protein, partial [Spraguea lophii 42_110]